MDVAKAYRNWRQYRSTVTQLSDLSDRSLADMGIVRANIRAVALKAAI